MNILVVDDEQAVKRLFEQRFRKELKAGQVAFRFAYSGEDAIQELASTNPPDLALILSDINMPGISGLELLRQVKDKFAGIDVFMITAYGDDDKRRQALEDGATEFFTKPIDFELLKAKIQSRSQGE